MAIGECSMEVPVGTYKVRASKVGYFPQSIENVVVLEGQTTHVNFQLAKGGNLVGLWHFDGETGTTAADSSGYDNQGTLINNPVWVSGIIGNALEFNGIDSYVVCGKDPNFDLGLSGDSFTLKAWVKPNQASPSDWGAVIAKDGITTNNDRNYWFGQNKATPGIYFGTRNEADNGLAHWSTNDGLIAGAWNHIAVIWDRTANDVILYINGTVKSWNVEDGGAPFDIPSAYDTNVSIGLSGDINAFPFNGAIDEVGIYNRALSAVEIKTIYVQECPKVMVTFTSYPKGAIVTID